MLFAALGSSCLALSFLLPQAAGGASPLPDPDHGTATRWLFEDPHELLPPPYAVRPGPIPAEVVALGDLDGDGDLDAYVGAFTHPFFSFPDGVWSNRGDGRLRWAGTTTDSGASGPVALGDLDGDQDLDALRGGYLLWNDGRGHFTFTGAILGELSAMELADLDGDGDLDVYAVSNFPYQDYLFLNDGVGGFTDASATLPPTANSSAWVETGDVDGDGDVDVLADARLYLNDGAALFSAAPTVLPPSASSSRKELVDVDGDFDRDVLSFDALFLNDGTGNFSDASGLLPPTIPDGGFALDVDADGDADLVRSGRLWQNDGNGGFTNVPGAMPPTDNLAPGDVDGDGDVDFLSVDAQFDENVGSVSTSQDLLLNDGQGSFSSTEPFTQELPRVQFPLTATFVDVDGDGDLDAAITESFGPLYLFRNDGTGRFSDAGVSVPSPHTFSYSIAGADVDGDGDVDLISGGHDSDGGALELFRQEPGGDFTYAHLWNTKFVDIELGDVDGDSDLDVLFASTTWGQSGLLLNSGAGVFSLDPAFPLVPGIAGTAEDAQLADVDGDGDLDALLAADPSRLVLNQGGTWLDASAQLSFGKATALASGDLDGDGDLDLLVGNLGTPVRVFENDSTGIFAQGAVLGVGSYVALADLDDDGDLDALGGGVFTNDGSGQLEPAPWRIPVYPTASGDVDGDGDLDIYGRSLFANLTRQVSWRTLPKLGGTLTLDIAGMPGQPWALFAAQQTTSIPTAFGLWRLDLATLQFAGSGFLDTRGRAAFELSVPGNPSLIGAELYWQAILGAPPQLSNLDTTTITGL